MGVVISVKSVQTPKSRYTPGPPERYLFEHGRLQAICNTFGWTKPPWKDPSEERGLNTSISNSRYSYLLCLAWAIETRQVDPLPALGTLIDDVEQHCRFPSEHQYPELRNNCKLFPHLLDRNIYTSYYLPVDYPEPLHITAEIQTRSETISEELSIGSCIRLSSQLHALGPTLNAVSTGGATTVLIRAIQYTLGKMLPMLGRPYSKRLTRAWRKTFRSVYSGRIPQVEDATSQSIADQNPRN